MYWGNVYSLLHCPFLFGVAMVLQEKFQDPDMIVNWPGRCNTKEKGGY
jgi:hypothetical protein